MRKGPRRLIVARWQLRQDGRRVGIGLGHWREVAVAVVAVARLEGELRVG